MAQARDVKDACLKSLLSKGKAEDNEDTPVLGRVGLYVRKRGGSITFRYRPTLLDGARAWVVLGSYPALSLKDAKDLHTAMEREVEAGLDPRSERTKREREMLRAQAAARAGG